MEQLKVLITLGKEIRAFRSFTSVQGAAEAAVNLGRQSEGWLRSVRHPRGRVENHHRSPAAKEAGK